MAIYKVTIQGNKTELTHILKTVSVDLFCGGPTRESNGLINIEGFVNDENLEALQKSGLKISVFDDVSEKSKERQQEVGKGNRYFNTRTIPQGFGIKQ